MDTFSLLNYQGSKKNLIDFIYSNCKPLIDENKAILDIFSGSGVVAYSFKRDYIVYANDCEYFSYIISKALLSDRCSLNINTVKETIMHYYKENYTRLLSHIGVYYNSESEAIGEQDLSRINKLYSSYPTVWNHGYSTICSSELSPAKLLACKDVVYSLFTTYYATSYFSIVQAVDIDSVRFALEMFSDENIRAILMSCLFYAMKECVFSKDGHMAQPLNPMKYASRMLKQRNKSILNLFFIKLDEFFSESFIGTNKNNRTFNLDFEELLNYDEIRDNVGFIYADPPYTDMQYSRYYHLLNVVAKYDYPELSMKNGNYTVGLYTEGRYQSKLSQHSNSLTSFLTLMRFCKKNKINLAISFAYPYDLAKQKSDRYVMSINDIIHTAKECFSSTNVEIKPIDYTHSNNRNSETKKVIEYLVLCKAR